MEGDLTEMELQLGSANRQVSEATKSLGQLQIQIKVFSTVRWEMGRNATAYGSRPSHRLCGAVKLRTANLILQENKHMLAFNGQAMFRAREHPGAGPTECWQVFSLAGPSGAVGRQHPPEQ